MVRGLYTAGWAMAANLEANDLIATNLANVDTPRFRRLVPQFIAGRSGQAGAGGAQTPQAALLNSGVAGLVVQQSKAPFTLEPTDRALDLVLAQGFTLKTTDGGQSADGQLFVAPDGTLVTRSGKQVEGKSGPVKVSGELHVRVDAQGRVYDDGKLVDKLTLLQQPGAVAPPEGPIRAGVLEKSNVDLMKEMVSMIEVEKSYEFCAKSVQLIDETLGKLNEVIRVA